MGTIMLRLNDYQVQGDNRSFNECEKGENIVDSKVKFYFLEDVLESAEVVFQFSFTDDEWEALV